MSSKPTLTDEQLVRKLLKSQWNWEILLRRPLSHQKHSPGNFSGRPVLLLGTCLPAVKVFVCRTQNACTTLQRAGQQQYTRGQAHPGSISQQHLPQAGVWVSYSSAAVALPGNSWPSVTFTFLKRRNDQRRWQETIPRRPGPFHHPLLISGGAAPLYSSHFPHKKIKQVAQMGRKYKR